MEGRPAKEGKFIPEDESLWGAQGKEILSELCTFSDMLPIAEDLGLVPDVVPPTLASLGICSTKVMRWERNWQGDKTYIEPSDYPPISMTCLSTHDSPTLAQWWRDFPDEVEPLCKQKKWSYTPILSFEKRLELLQDSHMTASLFHINLLQEYLALIPSLIHLDINEERINIPGQVLPSNWTYRFKPSIEQLVAHQELKSYLQQMLPHKK